MMIANIAIFECDDCKAVHVCRDETTWTLFELNWHECLTTHFCYDCRTKPANVETILRNREAVIDAIAAGREARVEYAN